MDILLYDKAKFCVIQNRFFLIFLLKMAEVADKGIMFHLIYLIYVL